MDFACQIKSVDVDATSLMIFKNRVTTNALAQASPSTPPYYFTLAYSRWHARQFHVVICLVCTLACCAFKPCRLIYSCFLNCHYRFIYKFRLMPFL